MIGVVLAAGTGRRLRPYTDTLPKALLPLETGGDATPAGAPTTPLDVILGNFARVGVAEVAVVVGFAADAVRRRQAELEERYAVTLDLIPNDRAETWNNCYSLWCARHLFDQGCLLANGDTVHPVSVEHALLGRTAALPLLLAVDTVKVLAEEEMKVVWSSELGVTRINKAIPPDQAYGEYIGVARIAPEAADPLATALEATWRRDPHLYYEDAFQALADGGFHVDVQPIGNVPWIEIDDGADLRRAGEVLRAIGKEG